jgi:hypothetical protein
LVNRFLSHIDGNVVFFGLLAVAAFWFAIQLCWSVSGKRWHSVAMRLTGAVVLFGVGVVMVFFTAFGAN